MCKLAGQMVSWWIVVAMAMAVFKHDGVDGVFTETCSSTSSNCTALVSYTAPANSTLAIVTALFGVSDIDSLLGANDFNLSTPATLALSPGDFLKVPVTCNCINGTRLSNSTIYEVVAGDTLTVIAEETYQGLITYQQIAAANGIVDVNYIQIGQSLVITFPCGCNPFADQPVVYLAYPVQSGDSIANISADFGAQMADVLSLNGIANASDLQVGSVLEVPIPACQASFLQSSIDSGLLVAEGGYELTAAKCVQCICTDALQLRCIPTPTSFNNACLESLQCANSILTIGNFTASRSSTGCDVTSCIYEGYTQGKTISSQVVHSTENQCPVVAPWTYDIPAPIGTYPTPGPTSGAPARIIIVIEVIVPVTVVTFLIAMVVFFLYWSTRKEKLSLLFQIQEEFAKQDVQPTLYAYNDIKIATRDFHPDMKIGQGSFGVVYKGTLQNGGEVAVKHLLTNSQQSIDEFLNEVVLITNVKHKNLVKLKGCCLMGGGGANKRYLVYEFVDNNNLAETIFGIFFDL